MATKKPASPKTPPRSAAAAPPWERKDPKKGPAQTHLTPPAKAAAKRRAKSAGRSYPNLVDNMWAAQESKK